MFSDLGNPDQSRYIGVELTNLRESREAGVTSTIWAVKLAIPDSNP